ncbi:hypothetical protein L915_11593 [Phytophthora nicotianae]|uniref:HTH psq-type domain-containing protein n=1 Tax=Phytophthora nicotianae TaxID=4792 RepID=W2GLG1_PHYNI|nr:hypothetical protein L915_11593 [Phytophthora nicotianae]
MFAACANIVLAQNAHYFPPRRAMKDVPLDTWISAMTVVRGGMSIRVASKVYKVSREPLQLRILGLVPIHDRTSPQLRYISDGGDRGLVKIIEYRALHGMCVGYDELRS